MAGLINPPVNSEEGAAPKRSPLAACPGDWCGTTKELDDGGGGGGVATEPVTEPVSGSEEKELRLLRVEGICNGEASLDEPFGF
jgi:hypothetical protein